MSDLQAAILQRQALAVVSLIAIVPSALLVTWVLGGSWSGGQEPNIALALLLAMFVAALGVVVALFAISRAPVLAGIALGANSGVIAWAVYVLRHIL